MSRAEIGRQHPGIDPNAPGGPTFSIIDPFGNEIRFARPEPAPTSQRAPADVGPCDYRDGMAVTSAGILLYRRAPALEVFIAHMGGPYWARKQAAAWTIPKGEYLDGAEDALAAARREFAEEIGVTAPDADYVDLGPFRYSSGKTVRVFAGEADGFEIDVLRSNTFEMEWPPRSGMMQAFPEVDQARWVDAHAARELLVAGQAAALEGLERLG